MLKERWLSLTETESSQLKSLCQSVLLNIIDGEKTEMNFQFIRENLIQVSVLDECCEFFLGLNEISLGKKTRLRISETE